LPSAWSGGINATVGAIQIATNEEIAGLLARHHSGDWGDLDSEDAKANEDALEHRKSAVKPV
jgi:hypothetical protein